MQAAWIIDDTDDEEGSDSDSDDDDGMVLDETESYFSGPKGTNNSGLDDDQASLNVGDSDEETEHDSVMMVIIKL